MRAVDHLCMVTKDYLVIATNRIARLLTVTEDKTLSGERHDAGVMPDQILVALQAIMISLQPPWISSPDITGSKLRRRAPAFVARRNAIIEIRGWVLFDRSKQIIPSKGHRTDQARRYRPRPFSSNVSANRHTRASCECQ